MATLNTDIKDVPRVIWSGLTTAASPGAALKLTAQAALAGCVQFTGTFGGATVIMQGSNDGTNWFTLKDLTGADVSATAAGAFEFTTSAAYIRASASGGTGDNINVVMTLRG